MEMGVPAGFRINWMDEQERFIRQPLQKHKLVKQKQRPALEAFSSRPFNPREANLRKVFHYENMLTK